jgi:Putative lumazine-binding
MIMDRRAGIVVAAVAVAGATGVAGAADADAKAVEATPRPAIRHEFTSVDVTDDAAVARVEIYRDGTHAFTDYLSLYRFPDGWRIVSKIFQAHGN